MPQPLVSIVLPTFNRLEHLPETVQSVFGQTLQDWELIVADDGSDQPVLEYLDALRGDERVRVLRLRHSGRPGTARNAGIAACRAPYVAFLDSDDLWEPSKLERQLAEMRAHPECDWCYTAFTIIDGEGKTLASERNRRWIPYSGDIFEAAVRTTASIRTPAVIARTELVRRVGAFDDAVDGVEDYDLWMRLALLSPACIVDEPLVSVRRHRDNRQTEICRTYAARDRCLRKLAQDVIGTRRALLEEERSRNALALAAALFADGRRQRSLVAVSKSLPFSWKYPKWWYGAARAVARACLARCIRGLRRH